jgi:hypothetical protein
MSEPESIPQRIGTFRPPVIGAMLADSIGVKRLQESIAPSVAKTAAPFADMHAPLAAQIGADVFASFASTIKFPTVTATIAPFSAETNAAIAAICARAFPAVEPIPD